MTIPNAHDAVTPPIANPVGPLLVRFRRALLSSSCNRRCRARRGYSLARACEDKRNVAQVGHVSDLTEGESEKEGG